MKKFFASTLLCATLLLGPGAQAAAPILVDGVPLEQNAFAQLYHSTTYVSLRAMVEALYPDASVAWVDNQAQATDAVLSLSAQPGALYIEANQRAFFVQHGVLLDQGCTLVPVRALAAALGAQVDWDPVTGVVSVHSDAAQQPQSSYDSEILYWLSRVISAESQGEPLLGKIAVGNVVLNRVASGEFPGTVYGVIFDERWGGQFECVRNLTIYQEPTAESILAAKLVMEGADVAGDALYFLAPALTNNHWIMENRPYAMTIGAHWFYR